LAKRWTRRHLHPQRNERRRRQGVDRSIAAVEGKPGHVRVHSALPARSAADAAPAVTRKAPHDGSDPEALGDLACACASARQAARAITQLYDRWLHGTGLEAPQFALLMVLSGHWDASQATIGRRYGLDKTTISRNLKWLERRGLIAAAGAEDAR